MQQKYLSSSGRRQLGSLFTNEVQKKVGSWRSTHLLWTHMPILVMTSHTHMPILVKMSHTQCQTQKCQRPRSFFFFLFLSFFFFFFGGVTFTHWFSIDPKPLWMLFFLHSIPVDKPPAAPSFRSALTGAKQSVLVRPRVCLKRQSSPVICPRFRVYRCRHTIVHIDPPHQSRVNEYNSATKFAGKRVWYQQTSLPCFEQRILLLLFIGCCVSLFHTGKSIF